MAAVTSRWDLLRRRPELVLIVTLAAAAIIGFVVWKLGSEIKEGETDAFDRAALAWVRLHLGNVAALRTVMLDLTALGDTATLTIVVLFAAGFAAASKKAALAAFLVAEATLGTSITTLVKPWFGRARPDVVEHWAPFSSASFPSGHSANSAVVYLSLALLAAQWAPTRPARLFLVGAAIALVVGIGFSRVFLGVHWPTDVFAGWALGSAWALVCVTMLYVYGEKRAPSPVEDRTR